MANGEVLEGTLEEQLEWDRRHREFLAVGGNGKGHAAVQSVEVLAPPVSVPKPAAKPTIRVDVPVAVPTTKARLDPMHAEVDKRVTVERAMDVIGSQLELRHSTMGVITALMGQKLEVVDAEGNQRPSYLHARDRVDAARKKIEKTLGVKFSGQRKGKGREYWVPGASRLVPSK